jgi:hypothetical protein
MKWQFPAIPTKPSGSISFLSLDDECNRDFSLIDRLMRECKILGDERSIAIGHPETAMRSVTASIIVCLLGTVAWVDRLEACLQSSVPAVSIRSTSVSGTITLNGKPVAGAVLSLHKYLGPYAIEIAQADPHPIANTIAGENGKFTFGEVPSGKYVIEMASPSSRLQM